MVGEKLSRHSEFRYLLVLYLSLPTFHFRGRKKENNAQRGWRQLANKYQSRNHKIYRKKFKSRNEAPDVEVWIGKLRRNTASRAALIGAWTLQRTKRSALMGLRVGLEQTKSWYAYKRYWCAVHFIEFLDKKTHFKTLKMNARMMRAAQ